MLEEFFAAEELEIRIFHPTVAQNFVRHIVHVFEDGQPCHQPRRQWPMTRLVGETAPSRSSRSASRSAPPASPARGPVDDLIQTRPEQVALAALPVRLDGISVLPLDQLGERITTSDSEGIAESNLQETEVAVPKTGKSDHSIASDHPRRSMASEFFTDD